MNLKILHIAPQNYAGVPYSFYQMHNICGDTSRIITLHKNQLDFPEDICLNFPLPNFSFAKRWRKRKVTDRENDPISTAPIFIPKNILEKLYFSYSDNQRRLKVQQVIEQYDLDSYDIIHYDAGLDFFRYPSQAIKWKHAGKKIVCCYYGSDLRLRGMIQELDAISDLNITSEYDHLALKKNIHYIFYPYDASELPERVKNISDRIRIIHTPTNRKYKGTDLIIKVIERIKSKKDIDFILLENTPRDVILKEKSTCDICIDQVGGSMGGTGYGKAGLETLAMGIPVITNMTDEYRKWLPENPFVVANDEKELEKVLLTLIDDEGLRETFGAEGKKWVEKYHGFTGVNERLYELYRKYHII